MFEDLFHVQLKTGGKKIQDIEASYEGNNIPSAEQIQALLKVYHGLDGVKVFVVPFTNEGQNHYTLVMWNEGEVAVEEPVRDFYYQMEQDALFGQYINEREEFLRDWQSGDYSAAGAVVFSEEEIEILEVIER